MIGQCNNCTPDYDTTHHPNNLDCPRYREVPLLIVNPIPLRQTKQNSIVQDNTIRKTPNIGDKLK
jgi:hypothetical protein